MNEHPSSIRSARELSRRLTEKRATIERWIRTLGGPQRDMIRALSGSIDQNLRAVREVADEAVREEHRERSEKMQEALAVAGVAIGAVVLAEVSISVAAAVQPTDADWDGATAETAAWMVGVGLLSIPLWIGAFWTESRWTKRIMVVGVAIGVLYAVLLGFIESFTATLDWPPQMADQLLMGTIPLRWVLLLILGVALGLPSTALLCNWTHACDKRGNRWRWILVLSFCVVGIVVAAHFGNRWIPHLS